jgi:hypothetical protein
MRSAIGRPAGQQNEGLHRLSLNQGKLLQMPHLQEDAGCAISKSLTTFFWEYCESNEPTGE